MTSEHAGPPHAQGSGRAAVARPAQPGDMVAVAGIMAHYAEHTRITFSSTAPAPEDLVAQLRRREAEGWPFLVAEDDGAVVGFAYADQWRPKDADRHTAESTVYLAPDAVGHGTGRILLGELSRRCALAGCRSMIAVVAESEALASAALHRAMGFVETGRLQDVGFKHGRWVSTLLMQKTLEAPAAAS